MFSISGKKEKKNSKLKIEIKFFRSGLFFTVGRERGNKSNFIFGPSFFLHTLVFQTLPKLSGSAITNLTLFKTSIIFIQSYHD